MRPGVLIRAAALVLLMCVIACCSGLSNVIAFNDSSKPIKLEVSGSHGEGWKGTLNPGESVEAWSGFHGPESMTFIVDGVKHEYDAAKLGRFARAGSGGTEVHWRWKGRSGEFKVNIESRTGILMNRLMAIGLIGLIGFALIVRFVIVGLQRRLSEAARERR